MYKNMKIAITDETHLKAVCEVLESMGYECGNQYFFDIKNLKDGLINSVATYESGSYYLHQNTDIDLIYNCNTVTLSDLLRMRDEMYRNRFKKPRIRVQSGQDLKNNQSVDNWVEYR